MRHTLTACILSLALALVAWAAPARAEAASSDQAQTRSVAVYLFYSTTCPHCAKAIGFLQQLAAREPRMRLVPLVLSDNEHNDQVFLELSQAYGIDPPAVPLILVGEDVFVGYGEDSTSGAEIEAQVKSCLTQTCADPTAVRLTQHSQSGAGSAASPPAPANGAKRPPLPKSITLPILGEMNLGTLSLPALTILLAAIDGFNPCAMWVLVFLIGLLIGMRDTFRMWLYGSVFLLTSGAVYFVFLAAWLNAFLLIGALPAIRIGVGLFALVAGGWYVAEFWRNPEAACKVTSAGSRAKMMDRMREAVAEPSTLTALASIMALAVAVNMIELLCSAGIPAVYTQILAMSELNTLAYYGYLLLYITIFMLDDALIFVIAMITLRQAGLMGTYARYSHLIGGLVLLGIGAALILRPEILAFA
jgi:hypothetical protein